jgi:hypothetical protein
MNLRLDQKTMGRFWFTDHGERVTTLKTFPPLQAVVMYLFNAGTGIFHRTEEHLHSLQHKNVLKNVRVPSARRIYPEKVTQFQEHHSIYHSRMFREWLSPQAHVELTNWSAREPGINPIKNTCRWRKPPRKNGTSSFVLSGLLCRLC